MNEYYIPIGSSFEPPVSAMKMPPPDALGEATDRLVSAMKALMPEDRHEALDAFGVALSHLCETLISRASSQSASAVVGFYNDLDRQIKQTNRKVDRKQTKEASTRTAVEDLRDRVEELERAVGSLLPRGAADNGR